MGHRTSRQNHHPEGSEEQKEEIVLQSKNSFIKEVSIQTPIDLKVRIQGITATKTFRPPGSATRRKVSHMEFQLIPFVLTKVFHTSYSMRGSCSR